MTDINTGFTQAPIGARLPRFLSNQPAPVGDQQPSYAADRLSVTPAGGAGVDPAQIQQQLQSQNPADRFRAVVAITNMPPAQAIPLLQMAAQNDNAQVRDLANQALGVMQRMPGGTQPATNQPQTQPVTNQPQTQPPANQPYNAPAYQPTQVPTNTYQAPAVGPMSADDAAFMVQSLQTEVGLGGAQGLNAIRTLAGIAQANPAQKEAVFNILLNHIYNVAYDPNMPEAIRAVAAMNDPRAIPYFQYIHRASDRTEDTKAAALQAIQAAQAAPNGQPGTASTNGAVSVEYLRTLEVEMKRGGATGANAFQQIRNALGPDPRAASPAKQEVLRILLTHITTNYDQSAVAAIQLIGAMGTRDMNALQYLDAVKRNPSHGADARAAANAAIQQIMAAPR